MAVIILSACRTAIGSFGGTLGAVQRAGPWRHRREGSRGAGRREPAEIDDVVLGCVLQAGSGMNVARQAAIKAGLPIDVPGETVNRVCGSGLAAVMHAADAIKRGVRGRCRRRRHESR